jgi:hypothetical protein
MIFLVTKLFGGVHFIFFWSVKESFQCVCLRCIVAVPVIFFWDLHIDMGRIYKSNEQKTRLGFCFFWVKNE